MHKNKDLFYCTICGLEQSPPPWGEDGDTPSFEICECCGVQYGYEDCTKDAILKFRKLWIKNGAQWSFSKKKPKNWSLEKQLKNIDISL